MPLHPDVSAALQQAHDAEATASEKFHKQEHVFTDGPGDLPKLGKFFDKLHKKAYKRQHKLRNTLLRHGEDVDTNVGDTSHTEDPGEALTNARKTLGGLMAAHQAVNDATRDAAKETDDGEEKAVLRGIREKYHGTAKKLDLQAQKVDRKQRQLKTLGEAFFAHKHS